MYIEELLYELYEVQKKDVNSKIEMNLYITCKESPKKTIRNIQPKKVKFSLTPDKFFIINLNKAREKNDFSVFQKRGALYNLNKLISCKRINNSGTINHQSNVKFITETMGKEHKEIQLQFFFTLEESEEYFMS